MDSTREVVAWCAFSIAAAVADSACSSKHDPQRLQGDELAEDPLEEQAETPSQEQEEDLVETTRPAGGAPSSGGSGTSGSGGVAGTPSAAGGDSTSAVAGSSGAIAAGGSAGSGSGGLGGTAPSDGGSAGTSSGGVFTAGGAPNSGGNAGSGGSDPIIYPPLTAGALGRPTRIASSVPLTLAEGPLWDPCAHRLLFVDVTASKIYSLALDGSLSTFASNTGNTNGIAFDLDGSLILAQMGRPGHISRRDKAGTITPLEPPGTVFHTPDDVTVRSDGTIYFTDGDFPPVGNIDLAALPVYVLKHGSSTLSNGGSVPGPNGVELSPDEKTLYVDAYFQGAVVKYAVAADGTITKGAALASGLVNPDSLCLDAAGNLYVGVSTGLQVLRPDGSRVGLIPIASTQGVTNCTFGGDDGKTLYITAWTSIWQVPAMPIPGLEWTVNRQRLGCM